MNKPEGWDYLHTYPYPSRRRSGRRRWLWIVLAFLAGVIAGQFSMARRRPRPRPIDAGD